MQFLEKHLEEIIFETANESLQDRDLEIFGKKFRQLRIGGYGVADIVTLDVPALDNRAFENITVTVYELKQEKVNIHAYMQAVRYIRGIQIYFEKRGLFNQYQVDYNISLIGKNIEDGDFLYLPNVVGNLKLYTYDYLFNGILFNQHYNYSLVNSGF